MGEKPRRSDNEWCDLNVLLTDCLEIEHLNICELEIELRLPEVTCEYK